MISVIIPAYNVEHCVEDLVIRLKNQTYKDFEAIIVDNNSKDRTYALLLDLTRDDKRFTILQEKRQGPNYARLCGFQHATKEYVYFFDSDDCIYDTTLASFYNHIVKEDSDVFVCDYVEINDNKEITKHCKGINYAFTSYKNVLDTEKSLFIKMPLWNKVFKREIIKENFFAFTMIGEDMLISLSCIANSNSLTYINEELYQYYVSSEGLSYQVTLTNVVGIVDTCKAMNTIFENEFSNKYQKQIQYIQAQHLLYRLLRATLLSKEKCKAARKELIFYLKSLNIKTNLYFQKSFAFKSAYRLLVNDTIFKGSRHFLKFLLTNKVINRLFKVLDK